MFKRELEEKKHNQQNSAKRGRGNYHQGGYRNYGAQQSGNRGFGNQGFGNSNYNRGNYNQNSSFGSGQNQIRCHACHGTGHFANNCPNRQYRSK